MARHEDFKRRILEAPEVQQCYHVTGDNDFVLIVMMADIAEYEAFGARLILENASIKRYRTSVVMNRVKVSLAVPVM